jgi:hypothetical protein
MKKVKEEIDDLKHKLLYKLKFLGYNKKNLRLSFFLPIYQNNQFSVF